MLILENIIITIAQEKDIPQLAELLDTLFTQELEFQPDEHKQIEALKQIVKNPSVGVIFVAKREDTIVGMISLLFTISTVMGGRVGNLEDLVIRETYRNKGIGTMLLEFIFSYVEELNIPRLTLLTDDSNYKAQAFYIRNGFELSNMRIMRKFMDK